MIDQLITEDEREQCKMMCNIAYPLNILVKTPMPRKIRHLGLSNAMSQTDVSLTPPGVSGDSNEVVENTSTSNTESNDDVKHDQNLIFKEDSIGKLAS